MLRDKFTVREATEHSQDLRSWVPAPRSGRLVSGVLGRRVPSHSGGSSTLRDGEFSEVWATEIGSFI